MEKKIDLYCTFTFIYPCMNVSNVWLWVTLFMIGVYFFMVMVCSVWLVGLIFTGWWGGGFKWWGRGYNRLRFQSGYQVPVLCYRPSKSWKISGTLFFASGCKPKFVNAVKTKCNVTVTRTSLDVIITMGMWKRARCF